MPSIIPIPAFADNYIWLIREGSHAVVVDPGDADPVADYLAAEGLELTAIVTTHHHGDHVGGNRALVDRWACPVLGPAHETIPGRTRALVEGDRVDVPGIAVTFDVLDVPGHTAGHIAYVGTVAGAPTVFRGDTLFAAGCGRLFEGTPTQMWSSLSKLAALDPATRAYCAHEYTQSNARFAVTVDQGNTALKERVAEVERLRAANKPTVPMNLRLEKATNPFLRAPLLKEAIAMPNAQDWEAFAEIRSRKDNFKG